MTLQWAAALMLVLLPSLESADTADLAPGGTLRAVYLAGNPAQAVRDSATGDVRQSGFLRAALERSGIVGIDVAPSGYGYGKAE